MLNKKLSTHTINSITIFLALAFFSVSILASEPVVWETNSREEILRGEARGVSVTDTGTLMLAPNLTQVFNTEQPYVWSCAIDGAGNVYLGTGHDGRIYRVTPDGKGALVYDSAELDVTALAIGRDGSVFAGTSPDGKVYRIDSATNRAEVYFEPKEKYIWSLAVLPDGALAIGTGDKGKLYRVRAKDAKPESSLLIDTTQTHVISLAVSANGDLIAGTDPGGLVLRIAPDGKAFALYDSSLREIHALAAAPDGSIYALALSDAASGTRATSPAPATSSATPSDGTAAGGGSNITVTAVDESGAVMQLQTGTTRTSRNDLSSARSAVFRIQPDGGADVLWSSSSITAFAVAFAAQSNSVLIGTADKGRVYSVTNDGRATLLLQSTEGQISAFAARGREVFAASSNAGKLFRFGSDAASEGTYESTVRDAKLIASWGRIWWRGAGLVQLQTRTGNTERPDTTWSDWSAPYTAPAGAQVTSPRARFIQWRATLRRSPAGGTGAATNNFAENSAARVEDVSIAYLPRNVAPEVLSITTLPVGVGLQTALQMPTDPNVESSGLDPALFGPVAQIPPRRLFQRGARSLQWQAEDRNNDTLEYTVYYRSLNEGTFRLLKDKLRDNFYTVDGAALADGRYLFKIVASDAPDNPAGQALTGERASEPVDIDNTPPVVRNAGEPRVVGDLARVQFDVEDATGMVKRADVSVDGNAWRAVFPDDGIADSPRERYMLELPITGAGEHTISLRAFDGSGNVGSLRVTVRR